MSHDFNKLKKERIQKKSEAKTRIVLANTYSTVKTEEPNCLLATTGLEDSIGIYFYNVDNKRQSYTHFPLWVCNDIYVNGDSIDGLFARELRYVKGCSNIYFHLNEEYFKNNRFTKILLQIRKQLIKLAHQYKLKPAFASVKKDSVPVVKDLLLPLSGIEFNSQPAELDYVWGKSIYKYKNQMYKNLFPISYVLNMDPLAHIAYENGIRTKYEISPFTMMWYQKIKSLEVPQLLKVLEDQIRKLDQQQVQDMKTEPRTGKTIKQMALSLAKCCRNQHFKVWMDKQGTTSLGMPKGILDEYMGRFNIFKSLIMKQ